ncbi:MAG TPA: HAD hydrolase family protein [Anaerolineae bacterium]|nr:HAD hydrolase family protein [Anaerolineae bacterium]
MAKKQLSELAQNIEMIKLIVFDFDGVFTDNMVYVFEDGREAVRCYRGDGIGLRNVERLGITPIILSTEINPVVSTRARKLRVRCIQGCENKSSALADLANEFALRMEHIAYVGNDVNDRECLSVVGLPIVVQDAHPSVVPLAQYRTQAPGGYGAVREVCDLFEQVLLKTSQAA